MKTKKLNSGFELPVLGYGTWGLGGMGTKEANYDPSDDIKAIKYSIDKGVTHIDTAELYAGGYTEDGIVAEAIKGYDRSKLIIASKVKPSNGNYEGVKKSCEQSLERVGTDYFDIYYIHWNGDGLDLEGAMKAMDELVEEGKIKHIGLSNFSASSFAEAQELTKNKIPVNQVNYNFKHRQPEVDGLLEYCQKNDVLLVAWQALKFDSHDEGDKFVKEISEKLDKPESQIKINWLINQKNVVTFYRSSTPEHIDEDLGALDWEMESEDIENIRKNYPDQDVKNKLPLS